MLYLKSTGILCSVFGLRFLWSRARQYPSYLNTHNNLVLDMQYRSTWLVCARSEARSRTPTTKFTVMHVCPRTNRYQHVLGQQAFRVNNWFIKVDHLGG